MKIIYRFNSQKFADDIILYVELVGWDNFIHSAGTTEKVLLRAIKWQSGTVSTHTLAKFCNAMNRSPLVYYEHKVIK